METPYLSMETPFLSLENLPGFMFLKDSTLVVLLGRSVLSVAFF